MHKKMKRKFLVLWSCYSIATVYPFLLNQSVLNAHDSKYMQCVVDILGVAVLQFPAAPLWTSASYSYT